MIPRRTFLIGFGGLVSASFLSRAQAFALDEGAPLLLDPGPAEETLFHYPTYDDGPNAWHLSLGPAQLEPPPPPTWREWLRSEGEVVETPADLERVLEAQSLTLDELDRPLDEFGWRGMWDDQNSPSARAYWLLRDLKVGCSLGRRGQKAGRLEFHSCPNPMSRSNWVEVRDDVSLSLLQAQLLDLGHRIRIERGDQL